MKKWIFPGILVILTFALYFNSLQNKFTYDDEFIIVNNKYIKDFKENFQYFFNTEYFTISKETTYRPIATLTYFLNYGIWKSNPIGYRLFSLLLHAINVLLVFYLLNKLFNNRLTSFVISLIYLAHPVLTEVINCVTYNEDLLTTLFFILSFIYYLKMKEGKKERGFNYFLSLLFLFAALLSKEMAITFLGIILLYDLFIEDSAKNSTMDLKEALGRAVKKIISNMYVYLGYLAVSLFYLLLLFVFFKYPDKPAIYSYGSLLKRIIFVPYNIFIYFKITFLPVNLKADYDFAYPTNFFSLINMASYFVFALIVVFSLYIYKHSKMIFFGIWWFLITLAPVLNIIEIYVPIAERLLYLPIVGFCIVIGALLTEVFDKIKIENRLTKEAIKISLISILILFYSYETVTRNMIWKDNFTLWTDTIKKSPRSARGYNNRGAEYFDKGSYDLAENDYKKSIEIRPDFVLTYMNLGHIYVKKGLLDDAIIEFKKGLDIDPKSTIALYNLGMGYYEKGQLNDAVIYFNKAIELKTDIIDTYSKLAGILFDRGNYKEALEVFDKALNVNPDDSTIYYNIASIYYKQGNMNEALGIYKKVIKISPSYSDAYSKIGEIYAKNNVFDIAEENLLLAIKYNPKNTNAYFNLGMVYALQERYQEAVVQWEEVLKLDPNHKVAIENLRKAKELLNK